MLSKETWGPHLWYSMHFIALGFPNEASSIDKKNYKNFYINLPNVIPCEECSKHLAINLNNYQIDNYLESREKLFQWTVIIHNEVNRMLGKSEWSVKEAYNYYTNPFFNLKNSTKCFSNSYFLIVLLLIFILLIILYKNNLFKLKFKK